MSAYPNCKMNYIKNLDKETSDTEFWHKLLKILKVYAEPDNK